ncbi:MAG: shikimate dehydrogenase family protein, partial [Anaerolineales bacterium]
MPDYYSFGLVGYPVEHSLSPRIHAAALQELGLRGEYRLYSIEQSSSLQEILDEMRSGQIQGLNVTIPYKSEIIPLMDSLSPAAQAVGAVNTISHQSGRLVGDNTDADGFLADLKRKGWLQVGKPGQRALILGAGGSARAVVYALASAGWQITVAARRPEQATSVAKVIQNSMRPDQNIGEQPVLSVIKLEREAISNLKQNVSLIVNTTPVGMYPQVDASPWPYGLEFPSQAAVYDLVYNPAET